MFNIILVIIGIILLGYSLYKHVGFLRLIKETLFKKWWVILLILVTFFSLGYIVFAYWLVSGTEFININFLKTLISLIFFFGAIFVVITISLIYSTVRKLIKEEEEIQRLQTEKIVLLQNKEIELRKEIEKKTEELQKTKNDLENKVGEQTSVLEKNLTEFEQLNKLTTGRELRMIELKKEIEKLKKKPD